MKPEDVTDKMISEQIVLILGLRGKRGTDLKTQIKAYSELLKPESAGGGGKVLEIRVQLVSAMFDCLDTRAGCFLALGSGLGLAGTVSARQ